MAAPSTSLRTALAQNILHDQLLTKLNDASFQRYDFLPKAPELPPKFEDADPYQGRVCVIGAGAAGLYTAMMLKYLGAPNVEILEANDRVGGRCYTQPLSDDPEHKKHHNYYDIGAMRIPDIPWMQQILNFVDYLGLKDDKMPYVYKNTAAPSCYFYRPGPMTDDKFDNFMKPIVASFTTDFQGAMAK